MVEPLLSKIVFLVQITITVLFVIAYVEYLRGWDRETFFFKYFF